MKWINPSKVIHDIASHTLGMVTMIVRPPMSFPLSLSLARCPSETTSHMYAYVCQPKQRPKFGCYLKQPAESGPTDLLEDFFFFNSECSLSMAVSHRVQVAGVMARGWRLHEKNVYHVFFLGGMTHIILIHHVLNGWYELWCHQSIPCFTFGTHVDHGACCRMRPPTTQWWRPVFVMISQIW